MKKLRLLLVDDHAVVREGLRSLLGSDQRFEIVGEAADGLAAVNAAEALHPDVVVLDVSLPGLNGAQLARRLKENLPRVNARGGPGGAPGCWQPLTHDLWPAPELVMDSGNSLAPYNHLDTGSPYAIEYVWGRQVGDNTINP